MSDTYDSNIHPFVTIKHPKGKPNGQEEWIDDAWQGVFQIVLHTSAHVWVANCYAAEGHQEVKRVGDGRSNGYDQHGACILSVPAAWCKYWTEEEANNIMQAIDADERLLGYAQ
jgi:hypothetical protein